MSLGGSTSQAVNDAAAAASDAGLFLAVAAGNEAADYHTSSPASEPKVFAVGASDVNDTLASFSNYGKALGVIAPGVDVLSIWMDGTTVSASKDLSIKGSDTNDVVSKLCRALPWLHRTLPGLRLMFSPSRLQNLPLLN